MDAIQAIDGTASATLDAVRALLSGEVSAPAPQSVEPAATTDGDAVSVGQASVDVGRAEASVAAGTLPDATPSSDGRATLAALAAESPQSPETPQIPQPHHPAVPHGTSSQSAPQFAAPPTNQAPVAATARAVAGGSQNVVSMSAAGSAMAGVQPGAQDTTWRSMNVRADVDTAAASRPLDSQVLPMPTAPLHTQAAELQRATHLPNLAAGVRDDDTGDAWHDEVEDRPDDDAADDAVQGEAIDGDAHAVDALVFANDPGYTTLRQWLIDGAQHAALRELDIHRRVILIVPSEAQARCHATARMHLLAPHSADATNAGGNAHSFTARWWPGAGVRSEWTAWRLHREAGIAGTGRLQSRRPSPMPIGACALLLRLGPTPPSLLDAGSACLDVADQHRFQQALGNQWSVLALLCPRGLSTSYSTSS